MSENKNFYTGKVRTVTRIGKYYYGYAEISNTLYICIQQLGDKGWLIKEEKYYSPESVTAKIKEIEKQHYDEIKFKTEARSSA